MNEIEGFYAAYVTGIHSQGLGLLVFRDGIIVGVDNSGVKYDGSYEIVETGFSVKLTVTIPGNVLLVQGVTTGPQGDKSELAFTLPVNFASLPFLRLDANHGPVNVRLSKLRDIQ